MKFIPLRWFALVCLALPLLVSADEKRLLILGDSLTKGYGLDPEFAFPTLLQRKMDGAGYDRWKVINGGLSGDTTAGGLRRINWLLKRNVDLLVVALGANDGLRGIEPSETERNLQAIIDTARKSNPEMEIVIAGMLMPDNFGKEYAARFRQVFPSIAKRNHLPLIPFLLVGVGGDPSLNQEDQIHPNQAGQEIVANTVWDAIEPIVAKLKD